MSNIVWRMPDNGLLSTDCLLEGPASWTCHTTAGTYGHNRAELHSIRHSTGRH